MTDKEIKPAKPKITHVKLTISNDQRSVVREEVQLAKDGMVIIMPKYKCLTFKKRLYWVAKILYRYWG